MSVKGVLDIGVNMSLTDINLVVISWHMWRWNILKDIVSLLSYTIIMSLTGTFHRRRKDECIYDIWQGNVRHVLKVD